MFKRTKISASVLLALGGVAAITAMPTMAQTASVEITGSRIKRTDAEGSLPVTVVTREQLEASGSVTVAEFIRGSTFSSAGQFRPQSGSSAMGFSGVDLRGIGGTRTLVLVDGRRVAKSPTVGDSVDMNSIPMAAVERIEILTDGASAIYGSDAIGGVVNIILRKDFEGLVMRYGQTTTSVKGGNRDESSVVYGLTGKNGRMIIGASTNSRDIIFQRDYSWGGARGASSFSNNYFAAVPDGKGGFNPGGFLAAVPGGCTNANFYVSGGRCRYDFTFAAADEAATTNKSVFARGDIDIGNGWSSYMNASVTRSTAFGRYAPVPGFVLIDQMSSPANLLGYTRPFFVAHRFAAGGNRDNNVDNTLTDIGVGFRGSVGKIDLDVGTRRTVSKMYNTGTGYVIADLAAKAFNNGKYNLVNPAATPASVIQGFTHTTGRDGLFAQTEFYGSASMPLFKLPAGMVSGYVGAEQRKEQYHDVYDSLSEGGGVLGSSGSSAGGNRTVKALSAEVLVPLAKKLDLTVAARHESYSDYGSDTSPKASIRWQPMSNLTLRASAGEGFSAPTLPQLTQKPSFSADSVVDLRHCLADGVTAAVCNGTVKPSFQINGLVISNPQLKSEKAKQWSMGGVWDVTRSIGLGATYWSTQINGVISNVSAQSIVSRNNGTDTRAIPAGLSITRAANGAILQITRGATNEGVWKFEGLDLNAVFQHKYAGLGDFRHSLTYSQVLKYEQNGTEFKGTFGLPKERAVLSNTWKRGAFGATLNTNMIGSNGQASVGFVGSYVTSDLQVSWNPPIKGSKIMLGAVNIEGKLPQLVSDNTRPFNFNLYDGYGRQVYVRLEHKF